MLKFGHIALSVSNLNRSIAFYGKHFGLRLIKVYVYKGADFSIAVLKKDGISLELFEFKNYRSLPKHSKKLESDLKTLGVKHFSLEVNNITKMHQILKKTGVKFAKDISTFDTGQRYFFVQDPDGILVEIMEVKQ